MCKLFPLLFCTCKVNESLKKIFLYFVISEELLCLRIPWEIHTHLSFGQSYTNGASEPFIFSHQICSGSARLCFLHLVKTKTEPSPPLSIRNRKPTKCFWNPLMPPFCVSPKIRQRHCNNWEFFKKHTHLVLFQRKKRNITTKCLERLKNPGLRRNFTHLWWGKAEAIKMSTTFGGINQHYQCQNCQWCSCVTSAWTCLEYRIVFWCSSFLAYVNCCSVPRGIFNTAFFWNL